MSLSENANPLPAEGGIVVSGVPFDGPVYISIDLDCLDPAFAPGVSHHEPGGLSTKELLTILQNLRCDIVGADIVEYNPERDINGMTGMVAAKMLRELLDKFMESTTPCRHDTE